MIGVLMLISGGCIAVYGHMRSADSPAVAKADGLMIAVAGYVIAALGLIVGLLA